jgi:hypothetical protein
MYRSRRVQRHTGVEDIGMKRKTRILIGVALCVSAAQAQVATRRASIVGNRGNGEDKCTIEVRVDISAEVEISGDMGRIRTMGGQPANWVRFECTSPIPNNPVDFRFQGVDGRGNVNLIRDPMSSRGVAVVRIDDPKGGAEGYTFDLTWRGGTGYNNAPGIGLGRDRDRDYDRGNNGRRNTERYGRDDDRYNRNDDRYDRNDRRLGRSNRNDRDIITCASNDGRRVFCEADTRNGVALLEQHGNAPCRQGSTWGYDRRGIWVDRGCRADFEVKR